MNKLTKEVVKRILELNIEGVEKKKQRVFAL